MKKTIFILGVGLSLSIISCNHLFPIRIRIGERRLPDKPISVNINEVNCNFRCVQEGVLIPSDIHNGHLIYSPHYGILPGLPLLCDASVRLQKLEYHYHHSLFEEKYYFSAVFELNKECIFLYSSCFRSPKTLETQEELTNAFSQSAIEHFARE